jgi:nucleoside-diphosphate-sugar epimerase
MSKVLVFGAGYIGSTLIDQLLNKGYQVRAVDNFYKGTCDQLIPFVPNPKFEFMFGDVTNPEDVKKVLDGVDYVVLLSAIVGFPACARNPDLAYRVNVKGAEIVMDHKPKKVPLIFSSTGSVYGALGEVCTENSPTNPPSWYGKTKLAAEQIYLSGENTIIHRYATAMGCGFNSTRVNLLVNTLVYEAITNKIITVFEADFKRTFIHVRDICSAIEFSLRNAPRMYGNVYNIGDDRLNFSKRELANLIQKKTGCLVNFAEVGKDFDVRNYAVSYSKINNLGWEASVGLEATIDELIKLTPMLTLWNRYN